MILASNGLAQTTRYVKPDGTGDGTSWANASPNIQTAIEASASGDSVFVAKGIYKLSFSIVMKDSVKIYGSFAGTEESLSQRIIGGVNSADSSVIDAGGFGVTSAVSSSYLTAAAVLDGFEIVRANKPIGGGGGIYNYYSSPTISHCAFKGNYAEFGGGIYNNHSSPTISHCIFSGNWAAYGGGIFNYSSFYTISNCTFIGNRGGEGGGGGFYNSASGLTLSNCTIYGNEAKYGNFGYGGGIHNLFSSSIALKNCIVFGNSSGIFNDASSAATISFSLIQEITSTSNGNIEGSTEPLFVNIANGNFQLQPGSPCINNGDTAGISQYLSTTDLPGKNRYVGRVDMGAYEWRPPTKWYVKTINDGGSDQQDGKTWATAFASIQKGVNIAIPDDSVFVKKGIYQPAASIDMRDGVKLYGSFQGVEDSYVQRAIGTSGSGDTSIIDGSSNGGFSAINNYNLAAVIFDGFKITGSNTGSNSGAAMNNNLSSSLTISNCAFIGNSADFGAGILNQSCSPTISNCIFSGNSASKGQGGGINNSSSSSPTIINCTFSLNTAMAGGGMFNSFSFPIISNCTFIGNSAYFGGGGGGIFNLQSSAIITNCTFSGNRTNNYGGGVYNYSSNPIFKNCIVYNNSDGVYNSGSSVPVVTYSLIQGMSAEIANHNLNGDTNPLFLNSPDYYNEPFTGGDYRLLPGSPAINAGDTAGISQYLGKTDLAGNSRYDGKIDMGAYEMGPSFKFSGTGNWSDPANWQNGKVPPAVLPGGACIIITGVVTLDVQQTISKTSILIIQPGANLLLPSNLIIK